MIALNVIEGNIKIKKFLPEYVEMEKFLTLNEYLAKFNDSTSLN